jgi:hypothetical protein
MTATRPQVIRTMALGFAVYAALDEWQTASLFAALGIAVGLTSVSDLRRAGQATSRERPAPFVER